MEYCFMFNFFGYCQLSRAGKTESFSILLRHQGSKKEPKAEKVGITGKKAEI